MRGGEQALKVPRWPLVISVIATLGVLAITCVLMLDLRSSVADRARENSENILHVIQRDIDRNLAVIELSLQAVVDGMARPEVMRADPALRRGILFDRAAAASGLGAFVVFDTKGLVAIDSVGPVPRAIAAVVDRDYFQAQARRDRGVFISRPYLSRLIGKPVIGLSRRISNPDGSFAGVALATLEISYFTRLLEQLRLGPNSVVSLIRDDGVLMVRRGPKPVSQEDVSASPVFQRMRAEKAGTFVARSSLDGVERINTFSTVGDRPLILTVAQSTGDVFADWNGKAIPLGLVLGSICALIVALTAVLTRELRRRVVAEQTLAALNGELARLSATDSLTGLGNRRAFDESLARELRKAVRTGGKLSLILLDVDHFKRFNDLYGHQEGDRVLSAVARAMRSSCGGTAESAFRVGGEEFAAVLPGTGLAGALQIAEQIRNAVRDLARPHADSPSGIVTVSLGVVETRDEEALPAFARADAALYASKREGRDRATADRRLAA